MRRPTRARPRSSDAVSQRRAKLCNARACAARCYAQRASARRLRCASCVGCRGGRTSQRRAHSLRSTQASRALFECAAQQFEPVLSVLGRCCDGCGELCRSNVCVSVLPAWPSDSNLQSVGRTGVESDIRTPLETSHQVPWPQQRKDKKKLFASAGRTTNDLTPCPPPNPPPRAEEEAAAAREHRTAAELVAAGAWQAAEAAAAS